MCIISCHISVVYGNNDRDGSSPKIAEQSHRSTSFANLFFVSFPALPVLISLLVLDSSKQ